MSIPAASNSFEVPSSSDAFVDPHSVPSSSRMSVSCDGMPDRRRLKVDSTGDVAANALKMLPQLAGPCLEKDLKEFACTEVNIHAGIFWDFLEPNETHPEGVRPHLDKMSPGLIVAVGTHRCFFDLICADPEQCEGLVVRDIDPKVKYYVDYIVLLSRIAGSREEFCALSENPRGDTALNQRLNDIQAKIEADLAIPDFFKEYYQKNLRAMAGLYYHYSRFWTRDDAEFIEVNYHKIDALFAKIQKYAKSGKIVATIGDINDLSFLRKHRVSVVDASNVYYYGFIDLRGCNFDYPIRLIWTAPGPKKTDYYSCEYLSLTIEERKELEQLNKRLNETMRDPLYRNPWWRINMSQKFVCGLSYTRQALIMLREFCKENVFEIPGCGLMILGNWPDLHLDYDYERFNRVSPEILEQIVKEPKLERVVNTLVTFSCYFALRERFLSFMDVQGWREAFEKRMREEPRGTYYLFTCLRGEGWLESFMNRFGKDRIAQWSPEHQAMLETYCNRPQP